MLTVVAAASAGAVLGIGHLLSSADALPMRTLAVRGADGPFADEVRAYASVEAGAPLFGVDLDAVASRVLEHPYVKSAQVRRVPPDALEIEVVARRAVAVVSAGSLYLADEDGALFKSARPGDGLDLPVVTGIDEGTIGSPVATADLKQALALLALHARLGAPGGEISEVSVARDGGLTLVLADGARVHLGDSTESARVQGKLARLGIIVSRLAAAGQHAHSIRLDDERRPERAAVRLRAGSETPPVGGT